MAGASPVTFNVSHHEIRYPVTLPSNTTVEQLKEYLRTGPLAEWSRNRLLRLIAGGRILTNDAATLAECHVDEGTVVHCITTDVLSHLERAAHRVRSESDTADGSTPGDQQRMIAGFGRLTVLGLDHEEISALRQLYLPDVRARFPPEMLPPLPGESEAERMLRAEDAWMRTQDPDMSEFALNLRPLVMMRARSGVHTGESGFFGDRSAQAGRTVEIGPLIPGAILLGIGLGSLMGAISLLFVSVHGVGVWLVWVVGH